MRKRTYNFLCVLVVLSVLMFGMYSDKFEADSFFACFPTEKCNSNILLSDTVIESEQMCNTEMLNVNLCREQEGPTLRGTHQRKDTKIFHNYLFCNFLSLIKRDFYVSSEEIQFLFLNQKEPVINYIHRADGKKKFI